MCLGPLMAGYLYASIGFFLLCTVLSSLFFLFIPLAYFYIGDGRHLINRKKPIEIENRDTKLQDIEEEEEEGSFITVAVSDAQKASNIV